MKKGIGTPENRELAYRVYALMAGRNIPRILYRLEMRHKLEISARTLYKWKEEGDWDRRMAGEDPNGRGTAPDGVMTLEERMLMKITGLMEKYEQCFEGREAAPDAQSAYAYTNLARAALEIARKMKPWEIKDPPGTPEGGADASGQAVGGK